MVRMDSVLMIRLPPSFGDLMFLDDGVGSSPRYLCKELMPNVWMRSRLTFIFLIGYRLFLLLTDKRLRLLATEKLAALADFRLPLEEDRPDELTRSCRDLFLAIFSILLSLTCMNDCTLGLRIERLRRPFAFTEDLASWNEFFDTYF